MRQSKSRRSKSWLITVTTADQDESDGDVELNDISFSCAGSPRISIIDGEVGDSQPIVRCDCLVELANEVRRFEFREDLEENDDWRVPSTYVPSASTLPAGASARRGPYNTIRPEAASVGASRFQVSSPATAYIASNAIKDHCCQWTQNDIIDPGKVLRARIRYGRAHVRKRLAGSKEMDAIFFDERKDETVTVVEVETSATVEGQTDTQTATVWQGT